MHLRNVLLAFFILLFILPSFAQHRPVQTGPRSPVDLSKVSPEVVEQGWFRIRLTREAGKLLDGQPVRKQQGIVLFGMEDLDILSEAVGLRDASPSFSGPAIREQYADRHRLWGLHLWYDIYIDPGKDVLGVVRMFKALDEVDVAEPVYRKELIVGEVFDFAEKAVAGEKNADGWIPDDPQFANQWHYHNTGQSNGTPGADISLPQAWDIEKGDPQVLVAIVDDGIQYTHPDLAGNMWEDIGFNFVDNNSNIVPGDHGTHVGGTVAAVTNNGVGVSGIAGGSGSDDGVRLMSAQVFRGTASGGFASSFVWAADNGAAISQNSWGYTSAGVFEQVVLDAIDYFNVNGGGDVLEGGITIFAAGNSDASGEWYPGYYEGAFSVAATNHNDQKAWYSNYGSWIDISAPGGETTGPNNQGVLSTTTGSSYAYYQGTSMACPHVSGVAALVLSHAPETFTNQELKELLVATADDHYQANPDFSGLLGSGRLNAYQALLETVDYLAGLINPSGFFATGSGTDQIDLGWTTNPYNDPIVLAYCADGTFGEPSGNHEPGEQIPGGGTVLLSGQYSEYVHSGLEEATTYYYRIWSNQDGVYSSGRTASGSTWCGVFELPFEENFPTQQMPLCWETYASSGQSWQIGNFSNGLNIEGFYAYSGSVLSFDGQNASLISPILDMTHFEEVSISFKHYFRTGFLAGGTGSLAYSLDNGNTWTTVSSWTSTTANPASYEVVIPELSGEPTVQLRWNMSFGFIGYYWTVGDLSVTGTPVEEEEAFTVTFDISDEWGVAIPDAIISFNGIENEPGDYVFGEMAPGTYNFSVFRECYLAGQAEITITNEDVQTGVILYSLPGDANGDGVVDVLDVTTIIQYFSNPDLYPFCFNNADVNGDGRVDVLDVISTVNIYFSGKSQERTPLRM